MAELEMDLSVPLVETGRSEQMPMRFRKLLDPTIPIPDDVTFEEHRLLPVFEVKLLLVALGSFILGVPLLTFGIFGLCGGIGIGKPVSGSVALLSLVVLFIGVGFLVSSISSKKLRRDQERGCVRLGNFYCKEALLQNQGNHVTLIPKNLFIRLENKPSNSDEEEGTTYFSGSLVYKGSFEKECRLKLCEKKTHKGAHPITVDFLKQWADCELREM